MDEKFNSILSIALIPQTVDLIVKNEGLDDISAMNEFYQSKTYEMLEKEDVAFQPNDRLFNVETRKRNERNCISGGIIYE